MSEFKIYKHYHDIYITQYINNLKPDCIREEDIIKSIKLERKVLRILIERKPDLLRLLELDCKSYNELFAHRESDKLSEEEYELVKTVFKEFR